MNVLLKPKLVHDIPSTTLAATAARYSVHRPARTIIRIPEVRPLPGGQSQWLTNSGGVSSALSRRTW